MSHAGRSAGSWLVAWALLSLTACSDPSGLDAPSELEPGGDEPSASGKESRTGTLSFELQTAADASLSSFDYAITGPNFSRTGSIDVSKSSTLSARIDAIPAGSGYSITVTGTSVSEPITHCSGSAGFQILARTVNDVPIEISCRVARSVTPPAGQAVPIPRSSAWVCGLALLGLGAVLAKRARTKPSG